MVKAGRKPKYTEWLKEEGLLQIEGWARNGLSDKQIAHNMDVHVSTLCEWKNKFPELREALKKGKEVVDIQVENALLKSALGYDYEESETIVTVNANGTKTQKGIKTIRHRAPDTAAQIFWLKNRKPEVYRDKHEIEHEGEIRSGKLDDIIAQTGGEGLEE